MFVTKVHRCARLILTTPTRFDLSLLNTSASPTPICLIWSGCTLKLCTGLTEADPLTEVSDHEDADQDEQNQ